MQKWFLLGVILLAGVRIGWARQSELRFAEGDRLRLRIPVEQVSEDWNGKARAYFRGIWVEGGLPVAEAGTWVVEGIVKQKLSGEKKQWVMAAATSVVEPAPGWQRWLQQRRGDLLGGLSEWLPPLDAALARGVVWGDQSQLTSEQKTQFRQAGMSHILVASGFNITLVASSILFFVRGIGSRRKGLLLTLGLLLGYGWVLGWGIPVLRALAMVAVAYGGIFVGRRGDSGYSLILLGAVFLVAQPSLATSVSFQLSFLATAGMVFAPELRRNKLLGLFVQNICIYVFTLPVLIANFGFFNLLAIPANVIIEPTIAPLTEILMLAAVVGSVWSIAGRIVAIVAEPLVQLLGGVAQVTAAAGWGVVRVEGIPVAVWVIYYGAVVMGVLYGRRKGWI